MLTDEGKIIVKRYLEGAVGSIALSMALGLGNRTESATDTALQFEFERADIYITSYDYANNQLVFKALLDSDISGQIYEIGLFTLETNEAAGEFGSTLISSFDSDTEEWTGNVTWTSTGTRIGLDSLILTPGASTTHTVTLPEIFSDLSGNSAADKFLLAFNNGNTNANTITVRLKTDASNYYSFVISSPATGYTVYEITKGALTVTGTPSWDNITTLEVAVNSKAAGASSVTLDGLRIEDVDTTNPDYVLVARKVVTPFTKQEGKVQEAEYRLPVTIG